MRSYKRVPRKSFRMRSSKNHGGLGREWSSKGLHPVRMRTPRKVVTRGLFSCLTGAWAADERSAPLTSHSSAVQSSSPVVHCYPRAMVLFGAGDSGHTLACYLKETNHDCCCKANSRWISLDHAVAHLPRCRSRHRVL